MLVRIVIGSPYVSRPTSHTAPPSSRLTDGTENALTFNPDTEISPEAKNRNQHLRVLKGTPGSAFLNFVAAAIRAAERASFPDAETLAKVKLTRELEPPAPGAATGGESVALPPRNAPFPDCHPNRKA